MSGLIKKGINAFYSLGSSSTVKAPFVDEEDEVIIPKVAQASSVKQPKKQPQSRVAPEEKKELQGSENDDKNYNLALSILKKPTYEIKNKKVYVVGLNELKHLNLFPYRHQREYNQEHVDVLKKGITQTGYLYHPIVFIYIPERKEISIIDGQHRFKALKSILEDIRERVSSTEATQIDIQVQIEMIECEDDDNKIMNIYKNVNTCQPIDMNKIVLEQDYVKVIQKLKKKFGKDNIKENTRNFKHYIIESNLKKELISHNLLIKYSEDELVKRIIRMNDDLKEQQILLRKLPEGTFKICEKNNFWLGTDFPAWLKDL